jgi:hypothetical protein
MDDLLVGYLLGSLTAEEERQVADHLNANASTRTRLTFLRKALAPLAADADPVPPPPGLVHATLARVAEQQCQPESRVESRESKARGIQAADQVPSRRTVDPSGSGLWTLDSRLRGLSTWLVAAVVLFLAGGIVLSLVSRQWNRAQRLGCADNMRLVWQNLQTYGDHHEGQFPRVEPSGARRVAGVFVPILREAGMWSGQANLVCPAENRSSPVPYTLAELEAAYRTSPVQYRTITKDLAGSYAYSLGYHEGARYRGLCQTLCDGLPILADHVPGGWGNSSNHGGAGQNVLYIGGDVRWCVARTVGRDGDDIYVNNNMQVGAGLDRFDTVLGASSTTP